MRLPWRKTLQLRIAGTLMLAFVAVGVVLIVYYFIEFKRAANNELDVQRMCASFAEALALARNDREAVLVVESAEAQFNSLLRNSEGFDRLLAPVSFQLQSKDGRLVYSPPFLQGQRLDGPVNRLQEQIVMGRPQWVARCDLPHWSVQMAQPVAPDSLILTWVARDLSVPLLIALPLLLLPVWFAVRRGLRPLHQLAQRLSARSADNLAPLDNESKYAELSVVTASFNQLLARLRSKVERDQAFIHDAAHELRTPMAVIAAQAHALVQAPGEQDRRRAHAELEHAIARAAHLSRQLLALASLEKAPRRAPQEVDASDLVRNCLARAAQRAIERNIELSLEAPDQLRWPLDAVMFQSILENLLDNALRYVHAGAQIEVRLALETRLQPSATSASNQVLVLVVADDGPGISAAERDQIFERFVRGKEQQQSGTGLGLAIVKQAAAAMGGDVSLIAGLNGRGVGLRVVLPKVSVPIAGVPNSIAS